MWQVSLTLLASVSLSVKTVGLYHLSRLMWQVVQIMHLKSLVSLDIYSVLVHLSFPSLSSCCPRPCLHQLGGSPTDTVLHKLMCVCIHKCTFNTYAQMSFFQLNQNNSGSLLSNPSSLPFTLLPSQPLHQAKKTLKGWTEKENDTAEGGRKQH